MWTAEEVEAYQQAMMKYDKDFFLVSKQVNVRVFICMALLKLHSHDAAHQSACTKSQVFSLI